jgi:hypothetical protein
MRNSLNLTNQGGDEIGCDEGDVGIDKRANHQSVNDEIDNILLDESFRTRQNLFQLDKWQLQMSGADINYGRMCNIQTHLLPQLTANGSINLPESIKSFAELCLRLA